MATRAEIYTAIRNADASGDSAAVRKLGEYLKSLPADEAAPGSLTDLAASQQRITDLDAQIAEQKESKPFTEVGRVALDVGKGIADTALTLGAQAVTMPAAGIAGAVSTPFVGADKGAKIVEAIQGAAYTPKSDVGQAAAENITIPFSWFASKADRAGDAVASATGSPALGAATNTLIQGAPAFLTKGARAPFVSAGKAAVSAVKSATKSATKSAAPAAATAAARAQSASAATAAATAEKYAGSVGLDWNALADSVKGALTDIAKNAGDLTQLDPQALARYARLQALEPPVPATRGQITRDPVQLRNEGNISATNEGAPIRDTHLAANNALLANLERLKGQVAGSGKTAAVATNAEEAGAAIQGAARGKAAAGKASYDNLFKAARETEPNATAPLTPVTDLLTSNPEIQHLGWVQSWLNKAAKLKGGKAGEPVALTDATLGELADLRSQASAIARTGGKEGFYAGSVVGAIDEAMQAVPAGAKAWRTALDAFKAHKTEFSEQGAVGKLVDNASRTDRATALERTIDTITNGPIEGIRQVKRSLLTGGDATTRTAGRQAMREIRAGVIERIKREATPSPAENIDGSPNLSAAKLKQALDKLGPQRLDEIFGAGTSKQLASIMQATKDVKTLPPSAAVGSSTLANVLAFLGKGVEKIPLVGGPAVDLVRGAAKLREIGSAARTAEKANTTPLSEVLARAKAKGARRELGGAVKTTSLSSIASGDRQ